MSREKKIAIIRSIGSVLFIAGGIILLGAVGSVETGRLCLFASLPRMAFGMFMFWSGMVAFRITE